MAKSRTQLTSSSIGLVPLNWKYSPDAMETYLTGIADYGFEGIQISGDQARSLDFLQLMESKSIQKAEQYLAIRCNLDGPTAASEPESIETIELAQAAGVEMLVFAVDGSEDRDVMAGRADQAEQLTSSGMQRLADDIDRYATLAKSYGMKCSFHPHAATYIESPTETRTLMNLLDPEKVGVCLDAGHWIVGGGDPVAAVAEYKSRITHIHVKDVSDDVLTKMLTGEFKTMHDAVFQGKLFVPAGQGLLNLEEFFKALNAIDYRGWLMSEQDSAYEPSEAASGISMAAIQAALAIG